MAVARRAAAEAARVHRTRSPEGRPWGEKGRADFVTDVDLEAQEVILETIGEAFPSHRIVAEEDAVAGGEVDGPADPVDLEGIRWIVDPLDGTTNWLHGYPEYAVSLAVEDDRGLRAALVLNSATGERFEAVRGEGAWRDGEPIDVSAVEDLEMALVGTGFPFKKPAYLDDYLEVFREVLFRTSGIRRAGSAALDMCDLACGRLDAFWEHWLLPWDVAGGALVVAEAGGRLETFPLPDRREPPAASYAGRRGAAYVGCNGALGGAFREMVLRPGGSA
jgi:myo-inositol-1(or 4)-monophosphatase